jgi:hypothetical protein
MKNSVYIVKEAGETIAFRDPRKACNWIFSVETEKIKIRNNQARLRIVNGWMTQLKLIGVVNCLGINIHRVALL